MLAYRSKGRGTPVVLLHAFPLSSAMWEREIAEIGKSALAIAPDLPGFGASPPQASPSIPDMALELERLLTHLEIREPVFVAGLSMGGYVAFEFLRRFPEKVRGLGLFSTRAAPDTAETREKRFKAIEAIGTLGYPAFARKTIENLLGRTSRETQPELAKRVLELMLANPPEAAVNALQAMAERRDSTPLLASIRFPVLVAAGEEDPLVRPEEAAALAAQIPGARLCLLARSGHLVNLEQPEAFGRHLAEFLAS